MDCVETEARHRMKRWKYRRNAVFFCDCMRAILVLVTNPDYIDEPKIPQRREMMTAHISGAYDSNPRAFRAFPCKGVRLRHACLLQPGPSAHRCPPSGNQPGRDVGTVYQDILAGNLVAPASRNLTVRTSTSTAILVSSNALAVDCNRMGRRNSIRLGEA